MDPKSIYSRHDYAVTWTIRRFYHDFRRHNFEAAEFDARTGLKLLTGEGASAFMLNQAAYTEYRLAEVLAATGQSEAANEAIARAEALGSQSESELDAESSGNLILRRANRMAARIPIEAARLDWKTVQKTANGLLTSIAGIHGEEDAKNLRNTAHRSLMMAAFAEGDYAAARRALDLTDIREDVAPRDTDTIQRRFNNSGLQLWRTHVLYRAGEPDAARKVLAALWPEVEAVFARAPDEIFNQIRMAEALRIKSEVAAELDSDTRRALLERAAGYLRPAAAAGKLTRYEREVLLAEVEAGLAGKPRFVSPGR